VNDAAVWVPVPAMFYWGWLVPLIFGTIFGWRYHRDKVRLGNGIWFSLFFYSSLKRLKELVYPLLTASPFLCVSLFVISEAKFFEIMQMLATMLQRDSTSMDVNVML